MIRDFYDAGVDKEWKRTTKNLYHRIEPSLIWRLGLSPCLIDSGSSVLDVGCGPGRYALEFALAGHDVGVCDISSGAIAHVVEVFAREGVSERLILKQVASADAIDLPPGRFDVAMVAGPLYHLPERSRSLEALRRVRESLVPGGSLVATFVGAISVPKDLIRRGEIRALREVLDAGYLRTGLYRPPSELTAMDYMPTTQTYTLDSATALLAEAGFSVEDVASLESWAAFLPEKVNDLDSDTFEVLLEVLEEGARRQDVIASSDHFLVRASKI